MNKISRPTTPLPQHPILSINLDAIVQNYLLLKAKCPKAETAAVVKANCYGTGITQVAPALYKAGCRTFFVATLNEALQLRRILTSPTIYVFNGLPQGQAELMIEQKLRPVIGSLEELETWGALCQQQKTSLPAALHYDTGMNRLGFVASELEDLKNHQALRYFTPSLVMSHLACGDSPNHELNQQQLKAFTSFTNLFPDSPASLANSAGIFLGVDYHFDLVRPGIALYGGCPAENLKPNPMRQVATVMAEILKIKTVPGGENVGYGGGQTTNKETVIATLNTGYADGYPRMLSASNANQGAFVMINDQKFRLLGRVSMDLLTVDVTGSKTSLKRGDSVEIIGNNITIDDLATQAQTISYEILTNLGARYQRDYKTSTKAGEEQN